MFISFNVPYMIGKDSNLKSHQSMKRTTIQARQLPETIFQRHEN